MRMNSKRDDLRELLAGTWLVLALLAQLLADSSVISRDEFARILKDAEIVAPDLRRAAPAAVRRMMERLGDDTIAIDGRDGSRWMQ